MNVLVIAPHPDDEAIGCGGTVRKHAVQGDRVVAVFLTSGELGLKHMPREKASAIREAEARKAARILGISETVFLRGPDWGLEAAIEEVVTRVRPVLAQEQPAVVYLPHSGEWHPDHRAALHVLKAAFAREGTVPPVPTSSIIFRGYEVWTPLSEYDHVEDITAVMAVKLKAIRAHHSQVEQLAYDQAARGLNAYRGAIAGRCRYAEVFKLIGNVGNLA